MTTSVTVVVATRDRPALLEECLRALSFALRDADRVIVVDSASRSGRVRAVAKAAGAHVVRCEQPGACRARNAGWRTATTEIVAFTDDDCLPTPRWIAGLSTAFTRFPQAGFVTGRVLPDSVVRGRAELGLSHFVSEQSALFAADDDLREMGHGANMAWRRQVLEEIGGFDEGMGPGTPFRAAED
ncbi:MAG: glycosyltransferase, partial [Acidimicrobiales bacterium]